MIRVRAPPRQALLEREAVDMPWVETVQHTSTPRSQFPSSMEALDVVQTLSPRAVGLTRFAAIMSLLLC